MGCRILQGDGSTIDSVGAVLYCSTAGWAFGPVFDDREQAERFIEWLAPRDPRSVDRRVLEVSYRRFLEEEAIR